MKYCGIVGIDALDTDQLSIKDQRIIRGALLEIVRHDYQRADCVVISRLSWDEVSHCLSNRVWK